MFGTPFVVNGSNVVQFKVWKGAAVQKSSDIILRHIFSGGPDLDGCRGGFEYVMMLYDMS